MQYLISKNDLLSYPTHYIYLLARYYNLPQVNRNDLLWLIAISNLSTIYHYAEMTSDTLWLRYKDQLLTRFLDDDSAKKYRNADLLPIEIINADPSIGNKKYLEWVITSYLDGGIQSLEDMKQVNTVLRKYLYLLGKKLIQDKREQNLNAFCGLIGCKQGKRGKMGLDRFLEHDQYKDALAVFRRNEEIQIEQREIKVIFEDDNLRVIQPLTEQASCKYGAGTKWCTAGAKNNRFKDAIKDGPIYILIPKNPEYENEKYQIGIEVKEYRNEKDEEVNYDYLITRFPELKRINKFRDWIIDREFNAGRFDAKLLNNSTSFHITKKVSLSGLEALFKVLEDNTLLEQLTIIKNDLSSLPDSIGTLTSLQILNLSYNKLVSVPDSIGNLTNLKTLDLTHNQITFLPDSIGNLSFLQDLNLHINKLRSLPDSIGTLTSLQILNLSDNELVSLPNTIGKLSSLQKLNIAENRLRYLSDSIGNLSSLQHLNLDYNQLTSLPDSIGNLSSLTYLALDHNKLISLPDSIGNLPSLKKLILEENELRSLPDSIGNLSPLETLSLKKNKLRSLPGSIGDLSSIQHLNLDYNQLESLPDSIGKLPSLKNLILEHNQLRSLPDSIGDLSSLQYLDLTHNLLTSLPDSIGKLSSLQHLVLAHNLLTFLPDSIGDLSSLQDLDLGSNKLESLPNSIGKLPSLERVSLYYNPINCFPLSLKREEVAPVRTRTSHNSTQMIDTAYARAHKQAEVQKIGGMSLFSYQALGYISPSFVPEPLESKNVKILFDKPITYCD